MPNRTNTRCEIIDRFNLNVSERTVSRSKVANLHSRMLLRKFITDLNKLKCLNFVKKYINMPISFWKKGVWSDESKFKLFGKEKKIKSLEKIK